VYVAAAWGFLQGLEYVSESFDWPEQLRQIALLAFLIGLPIVLVIAWYHGDRGQQRVTTPELTIMALLFLLGGSIFWYYQRVSNTAPAPAPPSPGAAFATDASIAVLPFVNMSSDKDQEYFADGISEELLNMLARVPELRVIARTSSFSFKGKDVEIGEIARRLNVANVLEGSVRKSGDTLRITAQLVRASDSSHLWSETYDRNISDVFAIQDEIAGKVVDALKLKLLAPGLPKGRTEQDAEAYSLVLQARYFADRRTEEAYERAADYYQRALARQPGYALAWAGLARVKINQANNGYVPIAAGIAEARAMAEKALRLDPGVADAYGALGYIHLAFDWDWSAADAAFKHALALAPNDARIIGNAALAAATLGHFDEAIPLLEGALRRDPLRAQTHASLGLMLQYAGRIDASAAAYRNALALAPDASFYHFQLGVLQLMRGNAEAALSEMEREPDGFWRFTGLALGYHSLGRKAESNAALASLIKDHSGTAAYQIAEVYAWRGETDRAFAWLDRAYAQRDGGLTDIKGDPLMRSLESDPRYRALLAKLKLPI
jgi:TolB-like protein/tetratricopeptide (TPR) repeat protein